MTGARCFLPLACASLVGACAPAGADGEAGSAPLAAADEEARARRYGPADAPVLGVFSTPTPKPPGPLPPWADWGNPFLVLTLKAPRRHDTDLAVLDRLTDQVFRFSALETPANESKGNLADKNHLLYFLTDAPCRKAVWRLDLRTQLIDPMPEVNGAGEVETYDVNSDGRMIVFVRRTPHGLRLYRFSLVTRQVEAPALLADVEALSVTITGDGQTVVYDTRPAPGCRRDIAIYDFFSGWSLVPPFVNGPYDDYNGSLDDAKQRLVFVSTRNGSPDLYLACFRDGTVQALTGANSECAESAPTFSSNRVIRFTSNRTGVERKYFYSLDTQLLDTVPVQDSPRGTRKDGFR